MEFRIDTSSESTTQAACWQSSMLWYRHQLSCQSLLKQFLLVCCILSTKRRRRKFRTSSLVHHRIIQVTSWQLLHVLRFATRSRWHCCAQFIRWSHLIERNFDVKWSNECHSSLKCSWNSWYRSSSSWKFCKTSNRSIALNRLSHYADCWNSFTTIFLLMNESLR